MADSVTPKLNALQALQQMTQDATPDWISNAVGPVQVQQATAPPNAQDALAYVNPNDPRSVISVVHPEAYTAPIAAHEATHLYQDTRNPFFVQRMNAMQPTTPAGYAYGGVQGLQTNPYKSVGDYNPEQQAQMVQDLAAAQQKLPAHMSRKQLQQWDATKQALERPIAQLQRVTAPTNSIPERADAWLARHDYGNGTVGQVLNNRPLERLLGLVSSPTMSTQALPTPGAPSAALGYPSRSKLVR